MSDTFWAIRCVWMRYFDVFRKNMLYAVMTMYVEPILYLVSFGFGLGSLIGKLDVEGSLLTYRQFIFAGIIAQSLLFQGFFEAAYGGFVRMYYQRIFKAMATTPITLSEVLWGELLWDGSKATFSACAVLIIGSLTGDFHPWGALACVPVCFVSAFLFGGLGLWVAAISNTIEEISYPQYLVIFPMFLFCGVFFPLQTLPRAMATAAWVFPLTSVVSLLRSLTLGLPLKPQVFPILLAWLAVLTFGSRWAMTRRLIK